MQVRAFEKYISLNLYRSEQFQYQPDPEIRYLKCHMTTFRKMC